MSRRSDREEGMILVNVLLFVAIASGMVMLMINREELALNRAIRLHDADRALAIAEGGEVSAIVALRRDKAEAPDSDYVGEAWGGVATRNAPITGGTFDLAIADAQGRFNVNSLLSGRTGDLVTFQKIARAAGLSDQQALAAVALVKQYGPITDLRPMALTDIDPRVVARLQGMVTALPGDTKINANAAPESLLAVLVSDPVVARQLVDIRKRKGFLTPADFSDLKVSLPSGMGFTSDRYWVRTRATIGDTRQEEAALIVRGVADGKPFARTVERWRNMAIPPDAPTLSGKD